MGENQQSMFFRVSENGGYLKYMPMLKGENDDPSNLLVPYIYIYIYIQIRFRLWRDPNSPRSVITLAGQSHSCPAGCCVWQLRGRLSTFSGIVVPAT